MKVAVLLRAGLGALMVCVAVGCGSDAPRMTAGPPPVPYPRPVYESLSQTGLFDDPVTQRVTAQAMLFEPTHRLWSDAATKRRWVRLPPGTRIETADMDHWVFPVGTKFWKEFSIDGVLLETRLVERYGDGPDDYWFGTFVWDVGQTDAVLAAPDGQLNINGTAHDAPSQESCGACHRGEPGRVLGLSALQVSRSAGDGQVGPTLTELVARDLLTVPPAPGQAGYAVPGDATTVAALGYLHANCGHCHNENGTSWPDTQMVLRLGAGEHDVETSQLFQSIVGRPLQYWRGGDIKSRVTPGVPEASAVVARMAARGTEDQMPPLATEILDPQGLAAVRAWVASLPATALAPASHGQTR